MAEREGQPGLSDETGASVTDQTIRVAVCTPVRDQCSSIFTQSLALAYAYMARHHDNVDCSLYSNNGSVITEQRLALARLALQDGADWTVWFDADMRFPKDAIERLLAHNQPIVAANYPTRRMPAIEPTAFVDDETQDRVYTLKESTGLQPVAAVGFGCIAVHRSVYQAMDLPWFDTPWDKEAMKYDCGEDIYFCRKARAAGFQVLIDHDLSKEIAHVGQMEFDYVIAGGLRHKVKELKPRLVNNQVNAIVTAA